MSFGFGVGDFITILDKASKLQDRFADAPIQFKAISNEVSNLKDVLKDIDNLLIQHELTSWQSKALDSLIEESSNIITAVGTLLDKNSSLDSIPDRRGNKARKTWQRLNWDPKEVQELRARMAFNIELLSRLLDNVASNVILETKASVDKLNRRQDMRERNEEQTQILDWLSNINFVSQQNDYIKQWQPGTGQWLLSSNHFQQWLETRGQVLFCPGIPGAGKTTLTAVVIDYLLEKYPSEPDIGIAYIYFDFRRKDQQNLDDLLSSLLKQLSGPKPSIPDALKILYNRHRRKRTRPSISELDTALCAVADSYSRTFVIIDALDECEASDGTRTQFIENCLALQAKCSVNLFMTSRFVPEIVQRFTGTATLKIRADSEDVQIYLASRMSRLPRFVSQDLEIQKEITDAIIKAVDGMFLLAQLYIDSLCGKRSRKAIRDALKQLQGGIEAYDFAYNEAMMRIEGQLADEKDLAKQALSWIVCAKRPLSIPELQHALAVEPGDSEICHDNITDIEDIVSVCAGLVTVDEQSGEIRLVHYTTQEYLQRTQAQWLPTAEQYITITCTTHLSFDVFKSGVCQTYSALKERIASHWFYRYACKNWGYHARKALDGSNGGRNYPQPEDTIERVKVKTKSEEAMQSVMDFLMEEKKVQAAIQTMYISNHRLNFPLPGSDYPVGTTALHLIARLGVEAPAKRLLANENNHPDKPDGHRRTPLHYAAMFNHEGLVKVLLANENVNPNARDFENKTPLYHATIRHRETIVRLLLAVDEVDPNIRDGHDGTPLSSAVTAGDESIVKLLLANKKVDPNIKNTNLSAPLNIAIEKGYRAIVRLLLTNDKIDPNATGPDGWTPLRYCALRGYEDSVQILLADNRIDPNIQDENGLAPLSYAAMFGHEAVAQLLLDDNAVKPDIQGGLGLTPLSFASRNGHENVVQILLTNKKIDPNTQDKCGITPLIYAAMHGHEAVVRLLLADDRVDPNRQDETGLVPLSHAAMYGHEAVVRLLLTNARVDPVVKDKNGLSPLCHAVMNDHEEVEQLLLAYDKEKSTEETQSIRKVEEFPRVTIA